MVCAQLVVMWVRLVASGVCTASSDVYTAIVVVCVHAASSHVCKASSNV